MMLVVCLVAGCHVDDVSSLTSSGSTLSGGAESSITLGGSGSGGSETSSSADSSAGDAGSTGGPSESCLGIESVDACAPFSSPNQTYATQILTLVGLDAGAVCPCASSFGGLLDSVIIEAPIGWPTEPAAAPLVVFHHGHSQSAEYYDFSALAAAGFVVLNVETEPEIGGAAPFGLLCGLEFAQSAYEVVEGTEFRHAVDCNALVAAHSFGANAAGNILAGANEPPYDLLEYILRPYALRGGMLLAPELRPDAFVGGPLPILTLASAADADIDDGRDALLRYDRSAPETTFDATETPRAMVYSWGTEHNAFGGGEVNDPDHGLAGQALVDGYLPAFAAATVFRDAESIETWWSYLTRESYPPAVLDPAVWAHTDDFTLQSPVHCAVLSAGACATTAGCEVVGQNCEQVDCSTVDANDCVATPGCVLSAADACMHLPRLRTAYTVDQAGSGTRTPIEFFESQSLPEHDAGMNVVVDDAADAIATLDFPAATAAGTGHETSLMLVQWGDGDEPGEIHIELPEGIDLNDYSHLSLRVGNVLDKTDNGDTSGVCGVSSSAPVSFELGMIERLHQATLSQSPLLSTGRVVQNDFAMLSVVGADPSCVAQQTMTTVRFPLAPLCLGVGATEATHLVLRFSDSDAVNRVLIDSIELTSSPLDDNAVCGTLQAGWYCQVDELDLAEVACAGEPTPNCDAGDTTSTPLQAPLVEPEGDDAFHGWWVQTPPGAVLDPESPTAQELALVRQRCVSACELEYANNPDVIVDCDAPAAFIDPVFAGGDARPSNHRFPASQVQGGGLFEGESLDCDLRTDCCEVFDEELCANRPARVTEARQGLGRGQEWSYGTDGIITLDSEFAAAPVQGTLSGTLGGSLCPGGNDSAPCPIYIGSATALLDEPVTLGLSCNGQSVEYELQTLDLALAQPAFGIMSHEFDVWSAMPQGGLVFDAHTVVDGLAFDTALPTQHGVGFMFEAGWANIPAYGKFEVTLDVPCNGILAEVSATFDVIATSWLGSPPEAEITVPATVACPDDIALAIDVDDAESDVASVRWRVDGVLLDDALTSVPFTRSHALTAIVRDSRGATTTVRKQVDCE
ncbi:MAG: hypothetical protein K1X88_27545 [Nannocystaceae bacterium]|nr:hypothetical protein [Nannocystaceae bacterium]